MKYMSKTKKAVISITGGLILGLASLAYITHEKASQYTTTQIIKQTVRPVAEGESIANAFVIDYKTGFSVQSSEVFANKIDLMLMQAKKGDYLVLNISSGGGAVVSCSHDVEQVQRVERLGIKTMSIIDYQAASCGYMLAAETNFITASRGAIVGNIGSVFKRGASPMEMLEKKSGIKSHYIGSTRTKEILAGAPLETKADIALLRSMAMRSMNEFKDVVVKGRGSRIKESDYTEIFSAMYWSGLEALELGLVDNISNYREMIEDLQLTNHTIYKIDYSENKGFLENLVSSVMNTAKKELEIDSNIRLIMQ